MFNNLQRLDEALTELWLLTEADVDEVWGTLDADKIAELLKRHYWNDVVRSLNKIKANVTKEIEDVAERQLQPTKEYAWTYDENLSEALAEEIEALAWDYKAHRKYLESYSWIPRHIVPYLRVGFVDVLRNTGVSHDDADSVNQHDAYNDNPARTELPKMSVLYLKIRPIVMHNGDETKYVLVIEEIQSTYLNEGKDGEDKGQNVDHTAAYEAVNKAIDLLRPWTILVAGNRDIPPIQTDEIYSKFERGLGLSPIPHSLPYALAAAAKFEPNTRYKAFFGKEAELSFLTPKPGTPKGEREAVLSYAYNDKTDILKGASLENNPAETSLIGGYGYYGGGIKAYADQNQWAVTITIPFSPIPYPNLDTPEVAQKRADVYARVLQFKLPNGWRHAEIPHEPEYALAQGRMPVALLLMPIKRDVLNRYGKKLLKAKGYTFEAIENVPIEKKQYLAWQGLIKQALAKGALHDDAAQTARDILGRLQRLQSEKGDLVKYHQDILRELKGVYDWIESKGAVNFAPAMDAKEFESLLLCAEKISWDIEDRNLRVSAQLMTNLHDALETIHSQEVSGQNPLRDRAVVAKLKQAYAAVKTRLENIKLPNPLTIGMLVKAVGSSPKPQFVDAYDNQKNVVWEDTGRVEISVRKYDAVISYQLYWQPDLYVHTYSLAIWSEDKQEILTPEQLLDIDINPYLEIRGPRTKEIFVDWWHERGMPLVTPE